MKLLARLRDLKLSLLGTFSMLSALKADHMMDSMGVPAPRMRNCRIRLRTMWKNQAKIGRDHHVPEERKQFDRDVAQVGNFKRSGGWLGRVYKGKTYKKRRHIFLANFSTLTALLTTRIF